VAPINSDDFETPRTGKALNVESNLVARLPNSLSVLRAFMNAIISQQLREASQSRSLSALE
jgi:hypothetical protein